MSKEIIYSFKEYQEKYNLLLDQFLLEYEESDCFDFINSEIEKYRISLKLIMFPTGKIFNKFVRVEYGSNLKSFSIPQEAYNYIFANENDFYYYKIYNNITGPLKTNEDIENKIKQLRSIFPKIISFLESKKSEFEITSVTENFSEMDLSNSDGVQKIIYLNELGIIDFIRNKTKVGISNGGMASILSAITGIKQGTLKPSLNRLDKKDIQDSRHPYYTTDTVKKVKKNLNDLGF